MLNQIIIVGRIKSKNVDSIDIIVPRAYKNALGLYDEDVFNIKIHKEMSNNISEYCSKGDLVGVKGRLENDTALGYNRIIADKITFLSSKNNNESGDE